MWTNSPLSIIENELPSPENSGWKLVKGEYSIDWEDPAEMKKVEGNIKYLLRGCAYKTGCPTTRYGCKKEIFVDQDAHVIIAPIIRSQEIFMQAMIKLMVFKQSIIV